jgi:uncharacterized lipoprotein NlpE involved in copper resistance
MKKIIFLLAILLILAGCDNGTKKEPQKKIDAGLVGDKWYIKTLNIYYRFTETAFIKTNTGVAGEVSVTAYTENGEVLATADNTVLLQYEYIDPSYYDALIEEAINDSERQNMMQLQQAAQGRNMVRFTENDVTVEWGRWARVP